MEKLICPQCGGNDLQPFGAIAYKCESCGTILKEEEKTPVAPPEPKTHYAAPVSDFRYDEDRDDYEPLSVHTDGSDIDSTDSSATRMIFWILLLLVGIGFGLYLIFS